MPGADLGRDGGKPHRQVRKAPIPESLLELAGEASPADQAGASESEVEIAEHAPAGQLATPVLEGIQVPRGQQSRHYGPARGAGNHLRAAAVWPERAQHPPIRAAAARP